MMRWAYDSFKKLPQSIQTKYEKQYNKAYALYHCTHEERENLRNDIRKLKYEFEEGMAKACVDSTSSWKIIALLIPKPDILEMIKAIAGYPEPCALFFDRSDSIDTTYLILYVRPLRCGAK